MITTEAVMFESEW